ncbi:hypothetical protein Tco_0563400 [Tanacetum coccineum]
MLPINNSDNQVVTSKTIDVDQQQMVKTISALALITPGWAAAFASPPAAMSFAMIAAGAAETANLKDKVAARAAALAVACDLKRNNKISSGRGLSIVAITSSQRRSKHDMERVMRWNVSEAMGIAWMESFARNMQLSKVDRRARFDIIAQHRRCTDPLKLERDKQNSVLALEALSSLLVNEDDDQDAFVNVDFNIDEMWLHEDIQTRPSAITEQQWTFHITKFRISLLINTDGMVR